MDLTTRRRALMAKIIALVKMVVTSATGLVSFITDIVRPVKVICEFSPIQEGTGDPSPDNVRPISGWTGVNIGQRGENLLLPQWFIDNGWTESETTPGAYRGQIALIADIDMLPKEQFSTGQYTIKGEVSGSLSINVQYTDGTNVLVATSRLLNGYTSTSSKQVSKISVSNRGGTSGIGSFKNFQIVMGVDVPDTYNAIGQSIPITFTDPSTGDPLTVYGGTVTLNEDGSADLVVDIVSVDLGTRTYSVQATASGLIFRAYLGNLQSIISCSCYKYVGVRPESQAGGIENYSIAKRSIGTYIYVKDPRFTYNSSGAEDLAAALSGQVVVVRTNSPQTYHFPNVGQLKAFLGTNNIWHNMNGSITAEYWKKQ